MQFLHKKNMGEEHDSLNHATTGLLYNSITLKYCQKFQTFFLSFKH